MGVGAALAPGGTRGRVGVGRDLAVGTGVAVGVGRGVALTTRKRVGLGVGSALCPQAKDSNNPNTNKRASLATSFLSLLKDQLRFHSILYEKPKQVETDRSEVRKRLHLGIRAVNAPITRDSLILFPRG